MGSLQTILVVDDEKSIRENYQEILEMEGYDVITAENGKAGLETYRKEWKKINLVISDWNMPVMNGGQMFIEMKKVNPKIKLIFASTKCWKPEESAIKNQAIFCLEKKSDFDTLLEVIDENIQ